MATSYMTPNTIEVNWHSIDNLSKAGIKYHSEEDVLFLQIGKPRPATSIDCNGEMWIRVDPTNGEIVGIEIEDFESVFIKSHHEIAKAWADIKPRFYQKKSQKAVNSFMSIIINFLNMILQSNPPQLSYEILPT